MNKINKVVFVRAYFSPVGKNEVVKVPTGQKKKGLLGGETDIMKDEKKWVQTGFSDCIIDKIRLTEDLQEAVELLNKEGYEVVSVTDVISGMWKYDSILQGGYGYGYSYTDGLLVIGRKI